MSYVTGSYMYRLMQEPSQLLENGSVIPKRAYYKGIKYLYPTLRLRQQQVWIVAFDLPNSRSTM